MKGKGFFLAALLIIGSSVGAIAQAPTYPSRVVTLVVPVAPGGVSDTLARALAQRLSQTFGQQFIVENRSGANHTIGASVVVKAAPDGYTLLLTEGTAMIPTLRPLPYNPEKDFAPVSGLITINQGVVVTPSLPVKNVKELVALAKSRPEGLSYANFGVGGILNMSMLASETGASFVAVPYRGSSPAMADVIAGHVPMIVASLGISAPLARAGKVRLIAVTSAKREPQLPEVPTIAEGGWPKFESEFWFGLFAPAGTPPAIVSRLNTEVQRILNDETFRQKSLVPSMFHPLSGSPSEFAEYIRSDVRKWERVIRENNIKLP